MREARHLQLDLFPGERRTPEDIIAEALSHNPVAIFAGYSGGNDSLATVHWAMNNVPGCRPLHINTGFGIPETRRHVRKTCRRFGWDLLEVRAKEDCGEDYERLVRKFGFPGPAFHQVFYNHLKGRCVEKVVRDHKRYRSRERVLFITGIRHDESRRRMGYAGSEVNRPASGQIWANPLYWWPQSEFHRYIDTHKLPRSPVSLNLGMSGECLCGAFAAKGEKELIRVFYPKTAKRIDRLEAKSQAWGHPWSWENGPPRQRKPGRVLQTGMAMCVGCSKTFDMFEDTIELAEHKEPK